MCNFLCRSSAAKWSVGLGCWPSGQIQSNCLKETFICLLDWTAKSIIHTVRMLLMPWLYPTPCEFQAFIAFFHWHWDQVCNPACSCSCIEIQHFLSCEALHHKRASEIFKINICFFFELVSTSICGAVFYWKALDANDLDILCLSRKGIKPHFIPSFLNESVRPPNQRVSTRKSKQWTT